MKVFLGSSREAEKYVAFARQVLPLSGIEAVPWTEAFAPNDYTLEALYRVLEETDGGIFFLTPDDKTWYRGDAHDAPRDNLIFEAGLFLAVHGRRRVALIVPSVAQEHGEPMQATLPTDLSGLTYSGFTVGVAQDLASTQLGSVLRTIAEMIKTGPGQSSDFGAALVDPRLKRLLGSKGVRAVHTIVAPWMYINDAIGARMSDSQTKEIDVLVAYRVNEVMQGMAEFRANPSARMRVCFADVFDLALSAVYRRKYVDRSDEDMRRGLVESVRMVLAGNANLDDAQKINADVGGLTIGQLVNPPRAAVSVYLTPQRITFGYYRIDDVAWIIPLDMKLAKGPSPFAWAISRSRSPELFSYYEHDEYDNIIGNARRIYPH